MGQGNRAGQDKDKGIIDYINGMYEQYHTERVENAIQDIERNSD